MLFLNYNRRKYTKRHRIATKRNKGIYFLDNMWYVFIAIDRQCFQDGNASIRSKPLIYKIENSIRFILAEMPRH